MDPASRQTIGSHALVETGGCLSCAGFVQLEDQLLTICEQEKQDGIFISVIVSLLHNLCFQVGGQKATGSRDRVPKSLRQTVPERKRRHMGPFLGLTSIALPQIAGDSEVSAKKLCQEKLCMQQDSWNLHGPLKGGLFWDKVRAKVFSQRHVAKEVILLMKLSAASCAHFSQCQHTLGQDSSVNSKPEEPSTMGACLNDIVHNNVFLFERG